jgi:aminopeptidase
MDEQFARWADVLVGYCLELQPRDLLEIVADHEAWPLITATYRSALRAGAHPVWTPRSDELDAIFFKEAHDLHLNHVSPLAAHTGETVNARLSIYGGTNKAAMDAVTASRAAQRYEALAPLRRTYRDRVGRGELRTCITLYPTASEAQAAGLSTAAFADYVSRACYLDAEDPVAEWKAVHRRQQHLVDVLDQTTSIRIEGEGTDIRFDVRGRRWVNSAARRNFPSGEVFTGPVEDSAHGVIRFSYPSRYEGVVVDGVTLEFDHGRLIKASASRGEEFFQKVIRVDDGASQVGELAIGTNYRIDRYIGSTLYDEKIGGTVHVALGNGYPETGSLVRSSIHWDLICDLRRRGRVFADGREILTDGRIKIDGWEAMW